MLNGLVNNFNNQGKSSFADFEREYLQNTLFSNINYTQFEILLRRELVDFLDFLFTDYNNFQNYKRIMLHDYTFKGIGNYPNYYFILRLLSYYSGNLESYRNVPVLLYNLIQKHNIEKYKNCSLELITKIIENNYDITRFNNYFEIKYKRIFNNYDDIDKVYDHDNYMKTPSNIFWKWAERKVS